MSVTTLNDIISEIQDHGFQDISQTRLTSFINDVYRDVNSRAPWPYLEATSSSSVSGFPNTTAAFVYDTTSGAVTAPTDIGKVLKLTDNINGIRLEPRRLDDYTQLNADQLQYPGVPNQYYFVGQPPTGTMYIYPVPTANTFSYTLRYLRVPPDLSSLTDAPIIPARHIWCIIYGALARCYFLEDDSSNWQLAAAQYENRIANMREDLFMQQYDRTDFIEDVDTYDWVDWLQDGGY